MAPLFGLRSGRWTYIRAPRPELYDRAADPEEKHNLLEASGPKAEMADDEAQTLDRMLTDVLERSSRFGFVAEPNPLDDETVAMLQALGYMDASDAPQGVDGMDPKDGVRAFDELDRARALIRAGKYDEAKKVLGDLLEWIPTNATAYNLLALCELRTNDPARARKQYLKSLSIEPRQPQVLRQLGRLSLAEGDATSARSHFREALNADPTDAEAMLLMAHLDLQAGAADEAARWYDRAIEADPGYVEPYLQYGNLYFRQGDFDEARRWYEKALEADPKSFAAATQVGMSALQTGDLDAAGLHFARAAELEPSAWEPDFNLACDRAQQGRTDAARELLQRARAKGFDNPALLEGDCFRQLAD
jgi:tetratricopeptide (TPR) repeat protein